jgi:hypothetical protein
MMDLDDLVDRAKQGAVLPDEVAAVAAALKSASDEKYRLLYVLGRCGATEHEELVAGFLDGDDGELAGLALRILAQWGRTGSYLGHVRAFVNGLEWDDFGDARMIAVSVAGEHLRTHTDSSLLTALLSLSRAEDDGDEVIRRVALEALAVALGDPVAETLRAGGSERDAWTARVLARAEERLAGE